MLGYWQRPDETAQKSRRLDADRATARIRCRTIFCALSGARMHVITSKRLPHRPAEIEIVCLTIQNRNCGVVGQARRAEDRDRQRLCRAQIPVDR